MTLLQSKVHEDILSDKQFSTIASIAHSEAGLVLVQSKASMISARLTKRVKELNLNGFDAYFQLLESSRRMEELPNLLSALTTNVSHFFREEHHFETLKNDIIPDLKNKSKAGEKIRIWSAGSSNGQELYSISMTLIEAFPEVHKYDVRLLGTDIDPKVIETAKKHRYQKSQLKGLTEDRVKKFFTPTEDDNIVQVCDAVVKNVSFRELNLISDWPMKHKFDVIFCRNVVIYFDEATQRKLWSRFEKVMKPDAWLFVGHSERVQDTSNSNLKSAGITAYRKM